MLLNPLIGNLDSYDARPTNYISQENLKYQTETYEYNNILMNEKSVFIRALRKPYKEAPI
jgi:hypothetical protein